VYRSAVNYHTLAITHTQLTHDACNGRPITGNIFSFILRKRTTAANKMYEKRKQHK